MTPKNRRRPIEPKKTSRSRKPDSSGDPAELRRSAEARLRDLRKGQRSNAGNHHSGSDTVRVLHELEVHQIELAMQNAELQKARNELESALEKYTDLYDFAPVGYFSVDQSGVILEANLTGAALLGVERSRLINRRLPLFVSPTSRPKFLTFLERAFLGPRVQACEALLLKEGGDARWMEFNAVAAIAPGGTGKWCRIAVSDVTERKQAEETNRRLAMLAASNQRLEREITQRKAMEEALQKSEQHQAQLSEQARYLSRRILQAQEDERKRISRELHDEIAQTLVGINVRLSELSRDAEVNPRGLQKRIARAQRLVEKSVATVHRFARELRPSVLDDLGLIPALHTFMKGIREQTGMRVSLSAFGAVEKINGDKRTVLYRVAQEALNNAARHAQASQAEVRIEKLGGAICVTIKDDGKGFQLEQVLRANKNRRLGLLGMRERLQMVGGNVAIDSTPGEGTTILAQIPLADGRARRDSPNGPAGKRKLLNEE